MKEDTIIARMIRSMPKCTKCNVPFKLVHGHTPQMIHCDMTELEDKAEFGCTIECAMSCVNCGPQDTPVLLFHSILYNDIKDMYVNLKDNLTVKCIKCKQLCFNDSIYYCELCTPIPDVHKHTNAMCGKCAITNHTSVGHYLIEFPNVEKVNKGREEISQIMSFIQKRFKLELESDASNPETVDQAVIVRINKKKGEDLDL